MAELRLKKKYFDEIASGRKTIEGRLMRGKICKLKQGDALTFINDNDKIETIITKIALYKDFKTGLEHNDLSKVLPGITSVRDGVRIYQEIFGDGDKQYGFCLISFILSDCATLVDKYDDRWLDTLYGMDTAYYDSNLSKSDVQRRHKTNNMLYVVKDSRPMGYIEYTDNADGSIKIVWICARGMGRCAIEQLKRHFQGRTIYANVSVECSDRANRSKARILLFQESGFKIYDLKNEGTGYIHLNLAYDPYN